MEEAGRTFYKKEMAENTQTGIRHFGEEA